MSDEIFKNMVTGTNDSFNQSIKQVLSKSVQEIQIAVIRFIRYKYPNYKGRFHFEYYFYHNELMIFGLSGNTENDEIKNYILAELTNLDDMIIKSLDMLEINID